MHIEPQGQTPGEHADTHLPWCSGHHSSAVGCRLIIGTAGHIIVGLANPTSSRTVLRLLDPATHTAVEVDGDDIAGLADLLGHAAGRVGARVDSRGRTPVVVRAIRGLWDAVLDRFPHYVVARGSGPDRGGRS